METTIRKPAPVTDTAGFHQCPVPGCRVRCRARFLMCYEHWRLVPERLKRQVKIAWAWLEEEATPGNEAYHKEVAREAIRAVTERVILR